MVSEYNSDGEDSKLDMKSAEHTAIRDKSHVLLSQWQSRFGLQQTESDVQKSAHPESTNLRSTGTTNDITA
jgi:hypothetical protein